MRKEEIPDFFLNKIVRLVKNDNFILTGTIIEINRDSLIFETNQATAVIELDNIRELVLKKEGNDEKKFLSR